MNDIFDIRQSSISEGITLIEASAGTGKTYAIAGMAVRLIAERGLGISEILIVTFTEAATQELRDRVRLRIRDAIRFLESGEPEKDEALGNLDSEEKLEAAIRSLRMALLSFDEAAIFTIHGFCQRMLRENAFETGMLFDVELLTDAEPVWRETAEDFWRSRFYETHPDIATAVVSLQERQRLSVEELTGLLAKLSRHPEMTILPEEEVSLDDCLEKVRETLGQIREEWKKSGEEIAALLEGADLLKEVFPVKTMTAFLERLPELAEDAVSPELVALLEKFSTRNLLAGKKKRGGVAIEHRFFDLCEEFGEWMDKVVRVARRDFIRAMNGGLAEAKRRRNAVTFDDLLTRLYAALRGPEGGQLAAAIGGRFAAALIDEFQDTDPVQWEIFYRVFGKGRHALYLIGDPKQAIYGFRGADIYTYLEARSKATAQFTLGTNWRSDKDLVEAANELFSRNPEAFVFPEIPFSRVQAARREELAAELDLGDSGLAEKPLQLVCVESDDGKLLNADQARERISGILVKEIHRLLTSGVRRKGAALEPGDIAVLTRTHREADEVRETLVQSGIPAVVQTDKSVLRTDEAEHFSRLLGGILEPHKNGMLKSALASPIFGYTAARIHEIDRNEGEWQNLTERFYRWQEIWNRRGFMRMFRTILGEERLRTRLLGLRDGERILTNYQHIAECLHAAEHEQRLTPSSLLRWLREQGTRDSGDSESYVLRLEKDEKAVQIVTKHRSKGLEYPVVFCPFSWTNINKSKQPDYIFHDPRKGNRLTWDLREKPDEESVAAFKREQVAEAMRLLYVAVTRARNRCYLFWAVTKGSGNAEDCALAHAFGCGNPGVASPAEAMARAVEEGWAELHAVADSEVERNYALEKRQAEGLAARRSSREVSQAPLITSFSGLTAQSHEILPDRDSLVQAPVPEIATEIAGGGLSIFTFPKGAKAGNFFHALLEKLDFREPDQVHGLANSLLKAYRFDSRFAPVVTRQVAELLRLRLPGGFCLSEIGKEDRLVEAPFYFPVKPVSARELAAALESEELPADFAERLGRLNFVPVDGYMTGFIDLIVRHGRRYFLVDWKTNWLGATAADYRGEALAAAMSRNLYPLQYHLYAVALHRHLGATMRDYDFGSHFGGVFYVFLRGIDEHEPESGIYYDRLSRERVERLSDLLTPHGELEMAEAKR